MGHDAQRVNQWSPCARPWILLFVSFFVSNSALPITNQMNQNPISPAEVAANYLRSFRAGDEFMAPSGGLVVSGAPDPQALTLLQNALLEDTAEVRSEVVDLLADVGAECADPDNRGLGAIKDARVIGILFTAGMDKPDQAREEAMLVLRTMCRRSDLAPWSGELVRMVEERPTKDGLLLVAKGKADKARPLLEHLAQLPAWQEDRALLIAQGALGDTAVITRYLDELRVAVACADPERYNQAVDALAKIGDPVTLKAVAEQLRTPWIDEVPRVSGKSMRLVVLEALAYAFPDELVVYPSNIIKDADYIAAENFCIRQLGAHYTDARPPFLTYMAFPR